jgi:YVTN family beta-propeller protein/YD repeat-containing protein
MANTPLIRAAFLACLLGLAAPALAASGSAGYTYDALGRIKAVTYDNGTIITYVYDAADNRTSFVVACGGTGCGGTLAPSAIALASNPDPSAVGQSVSFTASVTPITATGSVTFQDGTTPLGSGPLAAGSATFSTSALALGSHPITAIYNGDANLAQSTSAVVTQVVGATATSVASSANPATVGSLVTLTATVTGSNPTGTVSFAEGGVNLSGCAGVALDGSGNSKTAACSTGSLSVGTHAIAAMYSGDAANSASSGSLSQVINPAAQVPTITSGFSATFAAGQPGTFTFTATGVPAPTFSLSGCVLPSGVSLNATTGVLAGTPSIGAAGTYGCTLTATNSAGSAVQNFTLVVTGVTSTSLTGTPNPAIVGVTVILTATVTGSNPSGTVSFAEAGVSVAGCGAVALAGSGNVRTGSCTVNSLAIGTHTIVASYSGDSVNAPSAGLPLSQIVNASSAIPPPTALKSFNPSTIVAGGTSVLTITLNPKLLYVPSNGGNALTVIDSATNNVLTAVPVGSAPYYAAVNAGGSRVYVANSGSASVSVLDTSSNSVVATISVGTQPKGIAVSPTGSVAYVANSGSSTVSVIDTATNTVSATVATGTNPVSVAINPAGTRAYVSNAGSGTVSVFDIASNTLVATITIGSSPGAIVVNSDGSRAYVVRSAANSVSVIDTTSNTVTGLLTVGASPTGIALNPALARAYVTNSGGSSLTVFDTSTNTFVATVPLGAKPSGVAVNPLGTKIFVSTTNSIVVLNTTNSITATFTAGQSPFLQASSIVAPYAGNTHNTTFTDLYPPGLFNTATASATTTCSLGIVTAANNGNSVALSGGKILANDSCKVTVNVTGPSAGTYVNITGPITTNNVGTGAPATGTLTVSGP